MLRLIWRLILGGFALMLAIPFGTFVMGAGVFLDPTLRNALLAFLRAGFTSGFWELLYGFSPSVLVDGFVGFFKVLLLVVSLPPLLAALFGETFRLRSAAWYGGASGLLAAALPWLAHADVKATPSAATLLAEGRVVGILFVTGAASGLVYWAIAGWSAGRGRGGRRNQRKLMPAYRAPLPPPSSQPNGTASAGEDSAHEPVGPATSA